MQIPGTNLHSSMNDGKLFGVHDGNLLHSVLVDEEYTAIASHVDNHMRRKIIEGEYVDLVRLIPRDRVSSEEDQRMEIVNRGGLSYWVPVSERSSNTINNIAKWEEVFRIYSRIYTEGNPTRGVELIQYSHIIHKAALEYPWENVYSYDREFRIHMSKYPLRNWGVILQQVWTLKMRRQVGTSSHGSIGKDANGRSSTRNICWKFNQGRCSYGISCKFEHKCAICNKWGHGAVNCQRGRGNNGYDRAGRDYHDSEMGEHGYHREHRDKKYQKNDKNDTYHFYKRK